jgi:glycosyltransferase involved in cell wall biosynthesis
MNNMIDPNLKVCYFGTYRANYNRNEMMIAGLRQNGVEVIECHEKLWRGIDDRVETTSGGWKKPIFWWRVLNTYMRLILKFRGIGDFDILWVGYPGQFDVFLAWVLARLKRKPLVWDILMSIYLVALERDLDQKSSFTVEMLRRFERIALRLPDLLIQDTKPYVEWFHKIYTVPIEKFKLVPIGVDDRNFYVLPATALKEKIFRVAYYGTFIPNHGVEYIIKAAKLLKNEEDIHFDFIGRGPDQPKAKALAHQYGLSNVTFIDWMEKSELVQYATSAAIILGTFSKTSQSLMTVHNKVYEGMMMKKIVITGDSPAIRAQFTHKEHLYLVNRMDEVSLANGIRTLRENPALMAKIQENGHKLILEKYTLKETGGLTQKYLKDLLEQW